MKLSSRLSGREPDTGKESFKPVCTVLGGSNGSGKSSIFEVLGAPGEFVNADAYARKIAPDNPEGASLAAGKQVLRRLGELIRDRSDFVYETTLSSNQAIGLMRSARRSNYEVGLVFVVLASADLNVLRVADRVSKGGHHIPEATIRRRYESSFAKLAQALPLSHGSAIFDNTERPPVMLLRIRGNVIEENNLDKTKALHIRIAKAVALALRLDTDAVFNATR